MKLIGTTAFVALALAAATASAQAPNDAQIAAIVVTANQVDIDAGKLAQSMAASKEVKDFAQLMITDHSGVNKAATELVQKLKVTPEENPTSASLKKGGDENLAKLKMLKGAAFDRAYVDHEVTYHVSVLEAIDKTLIPSAQNAELKALLVKVRPALSRTSSTRRSCSCSSARAVVDRRQFALAAIAGALASMLPARAVAERTHTVIVEAMRFVPEVLTVQRGDRVVWVNKDLFPHTATANAGTFDSGSMAPSASWTYVAREPGRHRYLCSLHPTMTGTLTVQ